MINKVYQNDTCWLDYQYCSGRWHILGNTLLQSAVCCGTAMSEVMTDFVLLEAAEDGKILEDITDDVTEGSNIMFEVPVFPIRILWNIQVVTFEYQVMTFEYFRKFKS